jgi:hypothetical protein
MTEQELTERILAYVCLVEKNLLTLNEVRLLLAGHFPQLKAYHTAKRGE